MRKMTVPERNRKIFEMHFVDGVSFGVMAEGFGLSRQRVWMIYAAELKKERDKWMEWADTKARALGHRLMSFGRIQKGGDHFAVCEICRKRVKINAKLKLTGEAIEDKCPG